MPTIAGAILQLAGFRPGASGILFQSDNAADIGATAANRPRDLHVGRNAAIAGTATVSGALTSSTTAKIGAGEWPTLTIGLSGSRAGFFSATESGRVLIGDMQGGVGANRGGEILLGARGTDATANFAYAIIRGERDSAASATFSTQVIVQTMDAAGTLVTALTISSAQVATFAANVRSTTHTLTAAAPTVAAGQLGLGATTQTTVGAAGGASALPATPTGYLIINVAGTNRVVPFYAAA